LTKWARVAHPLLPHRATHWTQFYTWFKKTVNNRLTHIRPRPSSRYRRDFSTEELAVLATSPSTALHDLRRTYRRVYGSDPDTAGLGRYRDRGYKRARKQIKLGKSHSSQWNSSELESSAPSSIEEEEEDQGSDISIQHDNNMGSHTDTVPHMPLYDELFRSRWAHLTSLKTLLS
jgi:hypothetical protein